MISILIGRLKVQLQYITPVWNEILLNKNHFSTLMEVIWKLLKEVISLFHWNLPLKTSNGKSWCINEKQYFMKKKIKNGGEGGHRFVFFSHKISFFKEGFPKSFKKVAKRQLADFQNAAKSW